MSLESCQLCKKTELYFDDRLGESVCSSCGAVNVVAPFEEKTLIYADSHFGGDRFSQINRDSQRLGSTIWASETKRKTAPLRREHIRTNYDSRFEQFSRISAMHLSFYNVGFDLRMRALSIFKTTRKERTLQGFSLELQSAGITFFVLKEANIVCSLRAHSNRTKEAFGEVAKIAKRVARLYQKPHIFASQTTQHRLDSLLGHLQSVTHTQRRTCIEFADYVDRVYSDLNMQITNNRVAALTWIATSIIEEPITQTSIVKVWHTSDFGLRSNAKEMCEVLGIDRRNLSSYDIQDIVMGIRVVNTNEDSNL